VRIVSIDRQVAHAVENDIVVDDDLGLGRHGRGPRAGKRVRTATCCDSVTDALLGAGELTNAIALLAGPCTVGAAGIVWDRGVTASRARRIAGVSRAVVSIVALCGVVALHALARPVANLPAVLIARRTFGFIPAALAHPGRWIAGSVYGAVDPIIAVDPLTKLGLELDRSHIAPWPLRARCTTLIGG
jgi:hypothetical protein